MQLPFTDIIQYQMQCPNVQGSFEVLAQQAPTAVAQILDGMARRLAAAATARSTAQ